MTDETFIALDIETTGFDAETDGLIEIGATKFTREKTLDTFESLVNPEQPIPPMIAHITGITEDHVKSAPGLAAIKEKLIEFIGNHPIVGHNINFDISFLKAKGVPLKNKLYDTLDLASILLPDLPSYSLDTLTRILKIEHIDKHRALSDTIAAQQLFLRLYDEIDNIPEEILSEFQPILNRSNWTLKKLFQFHKESQLKLKSPPPVKRVSSKIILSEIQRKDLFDQEKSPLKKIFKSFETRPSQGEISDLITEHFAGGHNLLVEAGTGTGKTLAYLIAAVYFAHNHKQKVVISTHTKTLQDQILENDIPLLKKALKKMDPKLTFRTAQIKGKQNYISLKRLHTFLLKENFEDHEITFLIKILLWLRRTETGDLNELNFQGREFPLRLEVCTMDAADDSYLQRNRERARNADIIVVNHSLLMQECLQDNSALLPEYDYVIVDEAHHLEQVATDANTVSLSINSFVKPLESFVRKLNMAPKTESAPTVNTKLKSLIQKCEIFFGLLGIFTQKNRQYEEDQYSLLLREEMFDSLEWQKVKDSAMNIIEIIDELVPLLPKLAEEIEEEPFFTEILGTHHELKKKSGDLNIVFNSTERRICWTYQGREGASHLNSAPYNVGLALQEKLFNAKKSVVLTSSTLTTEKNFRYIKDQLSLDDSTSTVSIPSHFDYPNQVKILIPEDLPAPNSEGYFKSCGKVLQSTVVTNEGRTLVLFTSKKALQAMYMSIAPQLREAGYEVLAQGISGGRGKILQHFKEEPDRTVIFGTASFWEGIDIPGDMLTCVMMQKLPFDPPSDPIIASRGIRYDDSFNEYQLPRAIIKFKQGFGRLIRSASDTGTMIILDSRIIHSSYGRKFIGSLPEGITIEYPSVQNISQYVCKPTD